MNAKLLVVLLACAAFAVPALAAPSAMQPGLWEITMKTEMSGMPMAMPPQTVRHCYTKKDLEDERKTVPQNQDKSCQITNYTVKGNTASWTIQCKGENEMTGTGSMTVNATSYSGTVNSRMKSGGRAMDMTQSWNGKRVGDCK